MRDSTCFALISLSFALIFYTFVKKGLKLGETFVSRVDLHPLFLSI